MDPIRRNRFTRSRQIFSSAAACRVTRITKYQLGRSLRAAWNLNYRLFEMGIAVHRLVEHHAAARGEALACVDGNRALTYRELNARANMVARALMACGFKRGSVAVVRMPRSPELAIALLAVLKAGGSYMWVTDRSWPADVSIVRDTGAGDQRCRAIDISHALTQDLRPSPNLPIMTRGSDIACVIGDRLVPHATIAGLRERDVPRDVPWAEASDALDLWLALMTGATLTCMQTRFESAAA